MIPDSTTLEVRSGIVYWENTDFRITKAEAEAIADEVRELLRRAEVDAVLVDNSAASGTWPQEADEVWNGLMADMYERDIRSATICPSATNAMHVNRLSRQNDTDDLIRAFEPGAEDAAQEFVGATILV
jgi:hypothetical protein